MRKLIASALLIASLTGCAASSIPAVPASALDTRSATQATAWDIWDRGGASAKLRLDPSRPFRVDFMGASDAYPHEAPAGDAVVVGKDGRWYWFHLTYTG